LNTTQRIFSLQEAEIESFVDDLWWYRPDFLLVNPSYLVAFAGEALARGFELPRCARSSPPINTARSCTPARCAGC
jgi:hypothetical protein